MDFMTMEDRLKTNFYRTVDMFRTDFLLVVNNCRTYNKPDTNYYQCANATEERFNQLMDKFGLTTMT